MKKSEESINKLNNIELKENILLKNKEQLKNIEKSSYLNIFNSILGLGNLLEKERNLKNKKEIDLFYNKWEGSINFVNLFIEREKNKDGKKTIDKLIKIRKEIYDLSLIIDAYLIELEYLMKKIDEYGLIILSEKDYKDTPYSNEKVEQLIENLEQILEKNKKDSKNYLYIISEIISILPMRLVKENYYNIIKKTLMRNFKNYNRSQVEVHINEYKRIFDSSSMYGYGTKFDYYFIEIQKIKNLNLKEKNLEDLSKLINRNTELEKSIRNTKNINFLLGLTTNMNIVIALVNNDLVKSEIQEIYSQWRNILENNNESNLKVFNKLVEKEIESVEKEIFNNLEEYEALNMEAIDRKDFRFDDLDEELMRTKRILTYYNDSEFRNSSIIFPEDEEIIDNEYLDQSIDSLIQYINRSISKMDKFERRIRMRNLLSKVELAFEGIDDFLDYVKYALNNKIVANEEINFKIDHIYYFIREFIK